METYRVGYRWLLSLDQACILVQGRVGLLERRIDHIDNTPPFHLDILDILQFRSLDIASLPG
jgi:hypothetical protein